MSSLLILSNDNGDVFALDKDSFDLNVDRLGSTIAVGRLWPMTGKIN